MATPPGAPPGFWEHEVPGSNPGAPTAADARMPPMIVFVIGCRPGGALAAGPAASAIASLLAELPFLRGAPVREWAAPSSRFALACAAHAPGDVGGVRYVHEEARGVALFAGRPIRWLDGARADGRGPLDPRHYLAPAERWAPALDGRATAARCDDTAGELELFTDALGAYSLFCAAAGGASWVSNSAEGPRRPAGAGGPHDAGRAARV